MGNFFNIDNGFFTFMGKVWDMIMLSLVWVLCCIPLITIGPATTALYYTVVKVIRRDRGYVMREYFRSFKDNFKIGALSSVIYLLIAVLLYYDFTYTRMIRQSGDNKASLLTGLFLGITLLALFVFVYIFPILSRFTVTLKGLFKTSFFISIRHFPTSLMLVGILGAFTFGTLYILPLAFIGPALCSFICSFLLERVFKKYMPKPEETSEESGRDQWYWE